MPTTGEDRAPAREAAPDPLLEAQLRAAWSTGALTGQKARPEPAALDFAGSGEHFLVWRLEAGDGSGPLAVRVARQGEDLEALPASLREEAAALRLLPRAAGGPVGVHVEPEARRSALSRPFAVTSWVPGRALAPSDWTQAHLAAHARLIARIHQRRFPVRGALTVVGAAPAGPEAPAAPSGMSLLEDVDAVFGAARARRPRIAEDPRIAEIMAAARAEVETAEPLMGALDEFVLAHGDLCATNVVWDARGVPRPIDFEWAQADDRARDLAIIGGAVHCDPWYVPLSEGGIEELLGRYVEAVRELDPTVVIDERALRIRRDAWEVYEKTAMLLAVAERAQRGEAVHRDALPVLRDSLARRLAV